LIPNPIQKVLSTLSSHEVRYLLMGGQACVFYGGAEFSRDCDIAILCESQNLARLQESLDELRAHPIAVPPFEPEYLLRGHAVHFRCHVPEADNIRLDVMARMRGVSAFGELWSRRTTFEDELGKAIELLSLPDLVRAKKTQRDKDWPMIRRLVEASYARHRDEPTNEQVEFWLLESRTVAMLVELVARFPDAAQTASLLRPLLTEVGLVDHQTLQELLAQEQEAERQADREYWEPLKAELETLRLGRREH
jgi:hypothetical protein